MSMHASISLFLGVHALGLAVWLTLSVLNNCRDFGAAMAAVGATMSMAPLQQPPVLDTPLRSRAIGSPALHRAALGAVLVLQIVAAAAGWAGCWQLLVVGDLALARPWLNLALSALSAFLLAMHLGGLWFGYWIRQEGLQLTHLVLLLWTLAAFFLFNIHWA